MFLLTGTVIILGSQLAFGSGYILFLAGYFILLLAFLGLAASSDAGHDALARNGWPLSGRTGTWTVWGALVLGLGVLFFVGLPWGTLRTSTGVGAATATLPVTSEALPVTPGAAERPSRDEGGSQGEDAPQASQPAQRQDPTDVEPQTPRGAGPGRSASAASPGAESAQAAGGGSQTGPSQRDVALRVRSPVASYWRGLTYSTYDGQWLPDSRVALERTFDEGPANRFAQTYYVREPQEAPVLAYSPLQWAIVGGDADGGVLDKDVVYRGVSRRMDFSPDRVRAAALDVPPRADRAQGIAASVRELGREIAGKERDLLDQSLAITAYLRQEHVYDPNLPRDAPTMSAEEFLGAGAPGGSFDFASAQALLGRVLGWETRVATGYLPGTFDPLSGAYTVRREDAHAWAKVRVPGFGWVPFDPSPRTDLHVQQEQQGLAGRLINGAFDLQAGDVVSDGFGAAFGFLTSGGAVALSVIVSVASAAFMAWNLLGRRQRRAAQAALEGYSALPGKERRDLLAACRGLERDLRRRQLPRRSPAETLGGYFGRLAGHAPHLRDDLLALRQASLEAAYGPGSPTPGQVAMARERARRIRGNIARGPVTA